MATHYYCVNEDCENFKNQHVDEFGGNGGRCVKCKKEMVQLLTKMQVFDISHLKQKAREQGIL